MTEHTHRCVVDDATADAVVSLSNTESRHLVRVARRGVGDAIEVIDSAGRLWPGTVVDVGHPAKVRIGAEPLESPPMVPLRLVVGLTDNTRIDTLVEKATELGVQEIIVMSGRRSRRVPTLDAFERRRERMGRVADAAAKQCGRPAVPHIGALVTFDEIITAVEPAATIVLDPSGDHDAAPLITERIRDGFTTVIIGPDVGLDREEIAEAALAGVPVCRLGTATLRTETAALAAAVLAAYAAGTLET